MALQRLGGADVVMELAAEVAHGLDPGICLDAQAVQHRRRLSGDRTPLVGAQGAPGPVDQQQIVSQLERQTGLAELGRTTDKIGQWRRGR